MTLAVDVYTCDGIDLPRGGMFSPTTSSLVLGESEAVLVDTQYRAADVDKVIQRIEASGRTLTTIFVTHGHFDHYFGLEMLLERYPAARAVASPAVSAHIARNIESDRVSAATFFEGQALDNKVVPKPLADGVLWVDGSKLQVIDLEQADIGPTAIVHIPSIATVIAGDAIYNGVNPFLASSGPGDWPRWVASVDRIASLKPTTVIAGHKSPARRDGAECIAETRNYLTSFIDLFATCSDPRELVRRMTELHPDNVNPSALVMSAVTAFKRKVHPEG